MTDALDDARVRAGMERQLAERTRVLAEGQHGIGWKVGFGTPSAMEMLGTSAPIVGFLTDGRQVPDGGSCAVGDWGQPKFEPEIAVHLGRDLASGADLDQVRGAISGLGPAIELVDFDAVTKDVEELLATNVIHRCVVLGEADPARAGAVTDGLAVEVRRDGERIAGTSDPVDAVGDLVGIVAHVADVLGGLGTGLRAGEVIITGSTVLPPLPLEPDATGTYTYELSPVGAVSVQITD